MNVEPERIDPENAESVGVWSKKLDVTDDQIHEAVGEVGTLASDVELHLKGTRSSTNEERVDKAS